MARPSTVVLAAMLLTPLVASLVYLDTSDQGPLAEPVVEVVSPTPVVAAPVTVVAQPVVAVQPVVQPIVPVQPVVQPIAPVQPEPPVQPEAEEDEEEEEDDEPAVNPDGSPMDTDPVLAGIEALLLHEGQLVVVTSPDLSWAKGSPKVTPIDSGFEVRRSVELTRLPAPLPSLVGGRFVVYAADGSSCTAAVTGLSIYGEETSQEYADDGRSRPTRSEAREKASELRSYAHVLEASLDGAPACTGLWARGADLPAPSRFVRQADDASLGQRVRALFVTQPAFLALQTERNAAVAEMDAESRSAEPSWAAYLDKSFSYVRWNEIDGPRSFITAQFDNDDGCGGFNVSAAVIFELVGEELKLHAARGFIDPLALMDIDRDGKLEAITRDGLKLETRGDRSLKRSYAFPATFCPC